MHANVLVLRNAETTKLKLAVVRLDKGLFTNCKTLFDLLNKPPAD